MDRNIFEVNYGLNKNSLSVFKTRTEKSLSIQQGMSISEISEIVSEKVMALVRTQFQQAEDKFRSEKGL